jgi:L-iditol 2-dehydrogenase
MRAAVYYNNHDVRLEEVPRPEIGPGEMLVRIEASGICGSDVLEWYRLSRAPLVLGHEIAGQVAAVGDGVSAYQLGDRVAVAHHVPCNPCRYCLSGRHTMCPTLWQTNFDPGGFAEYVRLPAINVDRGVFRLPDSLSYEEATFIEPLACVLRGQRRAGVAAGSSVLVIGCGIAGLLHVKLARAMGAARIMATDIVDFRRQAALFMGADAAIEPGDDMAAAVRRLNGDCLADTVILGTGAMPAMVQGLAAVERGGTVLFFAPAAPQATLPVPVNDILWRRDVTLTTSYAGSPADYAAALTLISSGRVTVADLITHRLPLSGAGEGFRLVAEAKDSLKVIIEPQK